MSPLERAIVAAVAYSDVFAYPLTLAELRCNLSVAASADEVATALRPGGSLVPGLLALDVPYYHLAGRAAVVAIRSRRELASARLLALATSHGRLIARLPWVRMVAVTGSLAVANAEPNDDIDYLIVTAPGRVWLARALTIAVVRLAALRHVTLCPNYLLSAAALALPERERNLYAARELLQMRVVTGAEVAAAMLAANAWWRAFLPNGASELSLTLPSPSGRGFSRIPSPRGRGQLDVVEAAKGVSGDAATGSRPLAQELVQNRLPEGEGRVSEKAAIPRRAIEALLGGRLGDAIERWCYTRKAAELRRAAGANAEAVFDETVCKGHLEGHRVRLETALAGRLRELGVDAS